MYRVNINFTSEHMLLTYKLQIQAKVNNILMNDKNVHVKVLIYMWTVSLSL